MAEANEMRKLDFLHLEDLLLSACSVCRLSVSMGCLDDELHLVNSFQPSFTARQLTLVQGWMVHFLLTAVRSLCNIPVHTLHHTDSSSRQKHTMLLIRLKSDIEYCLLKILSRETKDKDCRGCWLMCFNGLKSVCAYTLKES